MRTRRQRLGQHFLHDSRVAEAIVAALPASPPRALEIGPGKGALTVELVRRFEEVRAVELDAELATSLARRMGKPGGLEVVHADALHASLEELGAGGPWLVAANLPYSVGTAIVRRLLPRRDLFPTLVVMVQKEVAERLVAPPASAARGLVSVEVELCASAEMLFTVPPGAFAPPPKVYSAVLRLSTIEPPAPEPVLARALELAGAAFLHRRKQLANALAGVADPHRTAAALVDLGLDSGARAQDLSSDAWLALAQRLPT